MQKIQFHTNHCYIFCTLVLPTHVITHSRFTPSYPHKHTVEQTEVHDVSARQPVVSLRRHLHMKAKWQQLLQPMKEEILPLKKKDTDESFARRWEEKMRKKRRPTSPLLNALWRLFIFNQNFDLLISLCFSQFCLFPGDLFPSLPLLHTRQSNQPSTGQIHFPSAFALRVDSFLLKPLCSLAVICGTAVLIPAALHHCPADLKAILSIIDQ